LDTAERAFGVEKFLDPEDIANVPRTEPNSMVTYLSQFYNVFHGKSANAGVGKIDQSSIELDKKKELDRLKLEKEKRDKENEQKLIMQQQQQQQKLPQQQQQPQQPQQLKHKIKNP
jgi:hypothetical protein